MRARAHCLYACTVRICLVPGMEVMKAAEQSYRLYSCARCGEQVRICSDCDRGNQYCAGECAQVRRWESRRRAAKRYQSSYRGALRHAARQRGWRSRRAQKVTHQGSLPDADPAIVAANSTQTTTEGTHVEPASMPPPPQCLLHAAVSTAPARAPGRWPAHRRARAEGCCRFCWRVLPPFARLATLRGVP